MCRFPKVFLALCFAAIIPFAAGSELHAKNLVFCELGAFSPGPFGIAGSQSGLPSGNYQMVLSQAGAFNIQNLQASWNGVKAGGYQRIPSGVNPLVITGVIPFSAPAGKSTVVTVSVYGFLGAVALQASVRVYVRGYTMTGWRKEWSAVATQGIDAYSRLYHGDFDGDGAEEILGVGSGSGNNVWITMFDYDNGDWQWRWSNQGDPNAGGGIYPYRNRLLVGDFDGDDRDELLGTGGWITMFHFDNEDWRWGWSNYGDPNAGHGIYPYRDHLIAGDFDGDDRDEVLGTGGWITMFHFDNEDWWWGWSNYGDPNAGNGIFPYRNHLRVGDFNGDDKDEVIGLAGWATVFHFDNGDWQWGWSTGGGSFSGWPYPLAPTDHLVIGDANSSSSNDEILFTQSGYNAAWLAMMKFSGYQPYLGWSNYGDPPLIDDWFIAVSNPSYFFVRAIVGQPEYLYARKRSCSRNYDAMYRFCQQPAGC